MANPAWRGPLLLKAVILLQLVIVWTPPPVVTNDVCEKASPSASRSWSDVVDQGVMPPVAAEVYSLPQHKATPRTTRRKPATVPETRIPTRRSTQPALVTSWRENRTPSSPAGDSASPSREHMDTVVESCKRKDPDA